MRRLVLVLAFIWACGGSDTAKPASDAHEVRTDAVELVVPREVVGEEVGEEDTSGSDTFETLADVPPAPGEPGYPCNENGQCNSGVCLETPQGKVCAQPCVENCPEGYTCKNLTFGADLYSVCVPLFLLLCDPCNENKDCNADATGGGAACVDFGANGRFCGGDCSYSPCPSGYECTEVADVNGTKSKQCVPAGGAECKCSPRAIKAGLSTQCYQKNEFGQCKGQRKCIVSGLTGCDAATPAKETCDGLDNDCNGLTDENLGTQIECEVKAVLNGEVRVCKGKGECVNGAVVNCDARTPVPEQCNGIDDDCNGLTDDAICDDGNPCTSDFCNIGAGGCTYQPAPGNKCDDGNPCTLNDHCDVNGNCVAGSQKNCDDGNVCTDDSCDTGTGECKHLNNTAPCEDGNKCTDGDLCSNGVCASGKVKDCAVVDPCLASKGCNPTTGNCEVVPANEGGACDDDNACTINDKCSNGKCVGVNEYCKAICAQKGSLCFGGCIDTGIMPICPCLCI